MKSFKNLINKFKRGIYKFLIDKIAMKDAKDEEGRYVKILGRAWSVIFKDIDFIFLINSEALHDGNDIALYSASVRYQDAQMPNDISNEKKIEVVKKVKELLFLSGIKALIMP